MNNEIDYDDLDCFKKQYRIKFFYRKRSYKPS